MFANFLKRPLFRWPTLLVASLLHLGWGILLVLDPMTRFSTPLYPTSTIPAGVAGLGLIGFSTLGFWALTRPMPSRKTLFALMPQQIMLVLSSAAIITSTTIGKFLDGVPRSRGFLLGDHLDLVILALVHTAVLVMMHAGHVMSKKTAAAAANGEDHAPVVEAPVKVVPPTD